ncbi:MAG: hypothetical protein Q7S46_01125 [Gallionella sp.]|nr:hypothetical protein [Gallionella sp.]
MKIEKVIVLITGGRTGSDFFQSLLDGHPEIMSFPGIFFFDSFWESLSPTESPIVISTKLCREYPHFFDSRLNVQERHHMLGANRNEFFLVDQAFFQEKFSDLMKDRKFSKMNILECLHAAYTLASKGELSQKKLILLHLHNIHRLKVVTDMDVDILYTLRDPLANLSAAVKNWLNYKESNLFNSGSLAFHIDRVVNGLSDVLEYEKRTFVVQLENLHTRHKDVMTEFCEIYGISFHECMALSTYHGKLWWGDAVSGKFLSGVNPVFKNCVDLSAYFERDVELLENALMPLLHAYGYPRRSTISWKTKWLFFMPMKYELRLWIRAASLFSWKEMAKIPLSWMRRILALRRACAVRRTSWPYSIGSIDRSRSKS